MRTGILLAGVLLAATAVTGTQARDVSPSGAHARVGSSLHHGSVRTSRPVPVPQGAALASYATLPQFEAALANPGTLVFEDFEGGQVGPYGFGFCQDPMDSLEDDGCFAPGQLAGGFSAGSSDGAGMLLFGEGYFGQVGWVVATASLSDDVVIGFDEPRTAVALNVAAYVDFSGGPASLAEGPVVAIAFDDSGEEIGRVLVPLLATSANFVGMTSQIPIAKVTIGTVAEGLKVVNDLWFGDVDGGGSNGVHVSPLLNHHVPGEGAGTNLDFVSQLLEDGDPATGDRDVNLRIDDGVLVFESLPAHDDRWMIDGGRVAALHVGDVVGPQSIFQASPGTAEAAPEWSSGADAYAGFRFACDGRLHNPVLGGICYGYLHVYTESGSGVPVTIVEYVFDGDGQPVTIVPGSSTAAVAKVTPDSESFLLYPGTSATTPLRISNLGAQALAFDFSESVPSAPGPAVEGQVASTLDISQMNYQVPVYGVGISCVAGGGTPDMSWWRRFYFSEHPVVDSPTTVHSVTVAAESGPPTPVTINVYAIPHDVQANIIPRDQLQLVGQGSGIVEGNMQLTTIPIEPGATIADTVNFDLVVEYHIDGSNGPFYPGANPSPQTHSTFLDSADQDCLLGKNGEPMNADSLFPTFHLIMIVNVDGHPLADNCDSPIDVPWLQVDPATGLVAGGTSIDSTVTVAAGSLAPGSYSANLCMSSNDSATPLLHVPVELTVAQDIPVLSTSPEAIDFDLVPGGNATGTLNIGNAGGGVLNYQILEQAAKTNPPTSFRTSAADASSPPGRAHFTLNPLAGGGGRGIVVPFDDQSISQMLDNTPGDEGASCPAINGVPSDTSWWRRFYFNEYAGMAAAVNVNSVTISSGSSGPDGQQLTINLYRIPHATPIDTIPTSALTLIGSGTGTIDSGLVTATIPVSGTIDNTTAQDLVVEWHIDGSPDGQFFPGANRSAESHPTFMSSQACGNTEPRTAAQLGLPFFHLVMVVNTGDSTLCQTSSDVPWLDVTPQSGSLASGESADSVVGVDAGSLAEGDYSANICVASNDPLRPVQAVPVHMSVAAVEVPEISVTPAQLAFSLPSDAEDTRDLEIRNVGDGTLHYTIAEARTATRRAAPAPATPGRADAGSAAAPERHDAALVAGTSQLSGVPIPLSEQSISQMTDNTPGDAGVACGFGSSATADNSWWRRFYFNEYPQVGAAASIGSVTISSGGAGPDGLPVSIRVYTIAHSTPVDTIPMSALTLIGSGTGTIDSGFVTTTIPVTGIVADTAGQDLVVEWHTDGNPDGGVFTPGANPSPETHLTFMSSQACSIPDPTPTSALGYLNFHLVMVVNVDDAGGSGNGCQDPGNVPWLTVAPAAGAVEAGEAASTAIGVNTLGLAAGQYSANVCIASDDIDHPVVAVPVSLDVTGVAPRINVSPPEVAFSVDAGETASSSITVTNTGGGTLDYTILEAGVSDGHDVVLGGVGAPGPMDPEFTISQMRDNTPGNTGTSCIDTVGGTTRDNSWWRRFYFNEHLEVGATASIRSVTVSSGPLGPRDVPLTINLYALPHTTPVDTIPLGGLTLIGTATGSIDSGSQTVTIPVSGQIADTVNTDLVVEWHISGTPAGRFIPGANASPETHPTFFSSLDCDTGVPVPVTDIGAPDFHLVMLVTLTTEGVPDCEDPGDVPWLSVTSAAGSLQEGQSADSTVTAETRGMTAGDYLANVCVSSNDADRPIVAVPIRLHVDSGFCGALDEIFCGGFDDATRSVATGMTAAAASMPPAPTMP
jgi:hypothetical protein